MTLAPNHRLNAGELDELIALIEEATELNFLSNQRMAKLDEAHQKLLAQRDLLK